MVGHDFKRVFKIIIIIIIIKGIFPAISIRRLQYIADNLVQKIIYKKIN